MPAHRRHGRVGPAASTGSACSTPTSSSRRRRRCGTTRAPLRGYEIHHGRRRAAATEDDWLGVGIRRGAVYGTHWHGLLDNDDVRRAVAHRGRRRSGPSRVRRRRRRRRPRAPRRPTRPDGRPAHRPSRRRRRDRRCWTTGRRDRPTIATRLSSLTWRNDATAAASAAALLALGAARQADRRAPRPGPAPDSRRSLLTAADFPPGVQYDRITREPGQPDGAGAPPAMLSRPEGCSDGLTRVIADSAERGPGSAAKYLVAYDGARMVITVLTWRLDLDRLAAVAERCAEFETFFDPSTPGIPMTTTRMETPRADALVYEQTMQLGGTAEQRLLLLREHRGHRGVRSRVSDSRTRRSPSKVRCRRRFWISPRSRPTARDRTEVGQLGAKTHPLHGDRL